LDDTDFYLIIETNVGQSNLVKKRLENQSSIFGHQKALYEEIDNQGQFTGES
jgi:hypothetical protein